MGLGRLFVSCTYGKVAKGSGVLEAAHSGNHIQSNLSEKIQKSPTRMARCSYSERNGNQEQWWEHVCLSRSTLTAWPLTIAWKSRPMLQ